MAALISAYHPPTGGRFVPGLRTLRTDLLAPSTPPAASTYFDNTRHLRPRSSAIDFSAEPITVKVGFPATVFRVDGSLLSEASPFFKAALKKEWIKGDTRIVRLPEEDPSVFNTYLNWVLRHQICLDIDDGETREKMDYNPYILAYALGDVLMDFDFKDAIADAFLAVGSIPDQDGSHIMPNAPSRRMLYEMTSDSSPLRKILVHQMAMPRNMNLLIAEDSPQFLLDVAHKLAEKDPEDVTTAVAKCRYHEHAKGAQNCYRTKYPAAKLTI